MLYQISNGSVGVRDWELPHTCNVLQEVRHKQQQYEHEKQEREREVVTPAADPVPVR